MSAKERKTCLHSFQKPTRHEKRETKNCGSKGGLLKKPTHTETEPSSGFISPSTIFPSGTNDLHVSAETDAFTQTTLKITVRCTRTCPCKRRLSLFQVQVLRTLCTSVSPFRVRLSVPCRSLPVCDCPRPSASSLSVSVGLRVSACIHPLQRGALVASCGPRQTDRQNSTESGSPESHFNRNYEKKCRSL